jgi:hypothetical protein
MLKDQTESKHRRDHPLGDSGRQPRGHADEERTLITRKDPPRRHMLRRWKYHPGLSV